MRTIVHLGTLAVIAAATEPALAEHSYSAPFRVSAFSEAPECSTLNITQLLAAPKPSSTLQSALSSYDAEIHKSQVTIAALQPSSVATSPNLCDFASVAAPGLLSQYTSFGAQAVSWWSAHSSAVTSAYEHCPLVWNKAVLSNPDIKQFFDTATELALCYVDAQPTTTSESSATEPSATPSSSSGSGTDGPAQTQTKTPNAAANQRQSILACVVVGAALVVASALL